MGERVAVAATASSRPAIAPVPAQQTRRVAGPAAQTRRKVISATVDLIERLSYPCITIDAVARASGTSRSTIYRYWPSRQALILEAYTERTNELTSVPDTGDALAELRTYLTKMAHCLNFGGGARTVSGLIVDALHDHEFGLLYRATLLSERRRSFLEILLRGQKRGQIRRDVELGPAVDALYGAVHHRLLVTREPLDEPFLASIVDLVTHGLAPQHAYRRAATS